MPKIWDQLKERQNWGGLVVFLCLLFTQFMVPVKLAGNTMYLYLVEFFLIALFLGACVHLLIKREKPQLRLIEFLLLGLLCAWFVVLTGYRYVYAGTITGGFIVFRVLVFPIVLVLLLRQYRIGRKAVALGLFLFLTAVNLYQIYSLFAVSHSFRQIKGLMNINIYLCFALAALPMLIGFVCAYQNSCKCRMLAVRAMGIFNVLAIVCFSLFSGSRIAVALCPVIATLSWFLTAKISRRSIAIFFSMVAAVAVLVGSMITMDVYDAEYNFYRVTDTLIPNVDLTQFIDSTEETMGELPEDVQAGIMNEVQESANQSVTDSDNMRSVLWEKSIFYIRQNPIFGRHSIDIDAEVVFAGTEEKSLIIEAPHNFILEMWLALGLPGMAVYLLMIALCAFKVLLSKLTLLVKGNFLLVMLSVFGFSFFQPLVTCYFAVSLMLWLAMYLFLETDK